MEPIYAARIGSYAGIAAAFPSNVEHAHVAKDTTVFLHSKYTPATGWFGTSADLYYKGKRLALYHAQHRYLATILGPTHPLYGERYCVEIEAYDARTPGGASRLRRIIADAGLLSSMDVYLRTINGERRIVVRDSYGFELDAHRIFIQAGRGVIVESFDAKMTRFVPQSAY